MFRLTRDVEQMLRRRGRNPHITSLKDVPSVKERSPHMCVSAQEKKAAEKGSDSFIIQLESSRASSRGNLNDTLDDGMQYRQILNLLSPSQSAKELNGMELTSS